jgi:hypothetical protein
MPEEAIAEVADVLEVEQQALAEPPQEAPQEEASQEEAPAEAEAPADAEARSLRRRKPLLSSLQR